MALNITLVNTENFESELEKLLLEINEGAKKDLTMEVQMELGKLVRIISAIRKSQNTLCLYFLKISIDSLLCSDSNIFLAKETRRELEVILNKRTWTKKYFFTYPPAVKVVLGLCFILFFLIPLLIINSEGIMKQKTILGLDTTQVLLVALFGALGSIISVMVRINDFHKLIDIGTAILFFTGFFKPIIGMCFALFIYAVLEAGVLPLKIIPEKETFFYMALSFVAGFSERFASDIAHHVEIKILRTKNKE